MKDLILLMAALTLLSGCEPPKEEPELQPLPTPTSAAPAAEVKYSQQAAVKKYPDLTKAGSPLNAMFVREYERQRLAQGMRITRSDWPLWLADECAARLKNPHLPAISIEAPPTQEVEAAPIAENNDESALQFPRTAPSQRTVTSAPAHGGTWVKPYTKKDGTYVEGYWRN